MKTARKILVVLILSAVSVASVGGCTGQSGAQGPAGQQGPAGVSVNQASVNSSGHLILTLSNGQTIDAGNVVGPQGPQGPSGTSTGGGASFASTVAMVEPKIVRIDVSITGGLSSGSGTIIDPRGYIITNAHVVSGARSIQVTLMDGTVLGATLVSSDSVKDMAIIKLSSTRTDFPVMTLGTMSDFAVGDPVMAGGFPLGTDLPGPATFTEGVVSAMRFYDNADFIQVDATVNEGNSGGCLFTLSGKMIGIPSAGIIYFPADYEDINLVIPIDQVRAYIQQNVPA